MSLGLIVKTGRILTARLLMGDPIEGITHCAIGEGDATFTDPINPPAPDIDQTTLKKRAGPQEAVQAHFSQGRPGRDAHRQRHPLHRNRRGDPDHRRLLRFEENEANGITIREYGFFGGDVAYIAGLQSDYAANGVYHPDTNPTGEVLDPGYLYEVKNIPDFNKTSDTRVELVGVIKI
jgi:hypothetical protein